MHLSPLSGYVSHFTSTNPTSNPVLSSVLNETHQSCLTLHPSLALVYRLKEISGLQYIICSLRASLLLSQPLTQVGNASFITVSCTRHPSPQVAQLADRR